MPQVIRGRDVYDVVVIGSGAAGGMAAKVLCAAGAKVALLEAGGPLDPSKDYLEHVWPYEVQHRGLGLPGGRAGFGAPNRFRWSDKEPYTSAPGSPKFRWSRSRIVGGRTNHYGRISLRFADYDFHGRSLDGYGEDWPISYDDVAPYYDKVERLIGVYGSKEGIRSAPDGVFQPPPAPKCLDHLIKRVCDKVKIPCIAGRRAVLTRPLNGRPACHYCGQCGRGCVTASNFSASQVLVFPALETGNLTLLTNAMARELITDQEGAVVAVSYVDKTDRSEQQIRGKAFVLGASSCESARLLLNSKSTRFPNGLANASNQVGRNLTDSVAVHFRVHVPAMEDLKPHNHDGAGGAHMYCPWWLYEQGRKPNFPRGYHIEWWGGRSMPGTGSFDRKLNNTEGYGLNLKRSLRQYYGSEFTLTGRGEMIPNDDCYCDIDPQVVDHWGIPVLRFHWKWAEPELKMAEHMKQTFGEMIGLLGGDVVLGEEDALHGPEIDAPGAVIHEVGTTRMGNDPKTSVVNRYGQAHDVKNLFVADGGVFTTNPDKNPTLTITALSWRMSDYLLDQAKKGSV